MSDLEQHPCGLAKLNVKTLKKMAKSAGIKNISKLKKQALIDALSKHNEKCGNDSECDQKDDLKCDECPPKKPNRSRKTERASANKGFV